MNVSESASEQYTMYSAARDGTNHFVKRQRALKAAGEPFETYLEHPPELRTRIAASTATWRGLLAQRIMYGDGRLVAEMSHFDEVRERTVLALNAGDDAALALALEELKGPAFSALQISLSIMRNDLSPLMVAPLASSRVTKRARKRADALNEPLLRKYKELAPDRAAQLESEDK